MTLGIMMSENAMKPWPISRRLTVLSGVLFWCTILLGACASTGSSAHSLSSLDVEPELRGCGLYSEPPRHGYSVEVQFVVNEIGEVKPGTVVVRPRRSAVGEAHAEQMSRQAIEDAKRCTYTPALVDGEPVAVRMTKRFYYPGEG
jgi:hypothetical protein